MAAYFPRRAVKATDMRCRAPVAREDIALARQVLWIQPMCGRQRRALLLQAIAVAPEPSGSKGVHKSAHQHAAGKNRYLVSGESLRQATRCPSRGKQLIYVRIRCIYATTSDHRCALYRRWRQPAKRAPLMQIRLSCCGSALALRTPVAKLGEEPKKRAMCDSVRLGSSRMAKWDCFTRAQALVHWRDLGLTRCIDARVRQYTPTG